MFGRIATTFAAGVLSLGVAGAAVAPAEASSDMWRRPGMSQGGGWHGGGGGWHGGGGGWRGGGGWHNGGGWRYGGGYGRGYYGHGYYGGGIAAGIIGGAILGSVLAPHYSYGYYPGTYYPPAPYYGYRRVYLQPTCYLQRERIQTRQGWRWARVEVCH